MSTYKVPNATEQSRMVKLSKKDLEYITPKEMQELYHYCTVGVILSKNPPLNIPLGSPENPTYISGLQIESISPDSPLATSKHKKKIVSGNYIFGVDNLYFEDGFDILVDKKGKRQKTLEYLQTKKGKPVIYNVFVVEKGMMGPEIFTHDIPGTPQVVYYTHEDSRIHKVMVRRKVKDVPLKIKANLYGQDHAVDEVFLPIKNYMAGMNEKTRPIASYVFLGPTGVGKTELASLIAESLGFHFERIDMGEVLGEFGITKLIGPPAGFMGYQDESLLEKAHKKSKNLVLLLDEAEKTDPKVMQSLLALTETGRIKLGNGKELSFTESIIILTSNLGTKKAVDKGIEMIESSAKERLKIDMREVHKFFSPEFIGRLSGMVEFNALEKHHMKQILQKFLNKFNADTMAPKKTKVELSPQAEQHLLDKGFDAQYGARPLKTTFNKLLIPKLVDLVLEEDVENRVIVANESAGTLSVSLKEESDIPAVIHIEQKSSGVVIGK